MISVKLKHTKEILAGLKKISYEAQEKSVRASTRAGANLMAERFKDLTPVWSGRTRERAGYRRVYGTAFNVVSFYIGTETWWVHILEWGGKRHKARHDLQEAFDDTATEAVEKIQTDLLKRIEKEARGARLRVGRRRRR